MTSSTELLVRPASGHLPSARPHEGRTAVVTGAARGIGQVYATTLSAGGAHVVVSDLDVPTETHEAIVAASAVECDVSREESVRALADQVAALGGADILVHNAGIYPLKPYDQISFDEWRRVLAVNLDSMFLLAQAFLPHMRTQKW